jgi:hypothetical protein
LPLPAGRELNKTSSQMDHVQLPFSAEIENKISMNVLLLKQIFTKIEMANSQNTFTACYKDI